MRRGVWFVERGVFCLACTMSIKEKIGDGGCAKYLNSPGFDSGVQNM